MREKQTENRSCNNKNKPSLEELWREAYGGSVTRRRSIDFSGDIDDEDDTESKDWYS